MISLKMTLKRKDLYFNIDLIFEYNCLPHFFPFFPFSRVKDNYDVASSDYFTACERLRETGKKSKV